MNILHVISSFPPAYAYGGPVESSYQITRNLVEQGHQVSVFTTDVLDADSRNADYSDPDYLDGIRVRRFRNLSNNLAWKANISTAFGIWPALRDEIANFDVVHLHEFRSFEAAIASYEASRAGIPLVLQPRGAIPRKSKRTQKAVFDQILGKRILASSDHLIASSHIESGQYQEVFPAVREKSITHLPNGIEKDEYKDLPQEGTFRAKYGIDDGSEMILYLGRLHERKGIDLLIRAFEGMESGQNRDLVIVGPDDGNLTSLQQLQQQLQAKNISFTGPMYNEEKLAAYVDADLFVLPSKNKYESFGNVVIEAMACGTPAMTTNVCGFAEWLDFEASQSVDPNPQALREGAEEILQTNIKSSSIREYVWSNFPWDTVAEGTTKIYQQVL
jgi:glycosyltransferase involved in cell wall biosynthesis